MENNIKEEILQNYKKEEVKKTNFPTEIVELPSHGWPYSKNSELYSGKIEMKYMTAREEDILTTQSYIKRGVVLDKLLQSLIISNINYDDLLIVDKNALLIAARVLGYGKDYEIEHECSNCNTKSKIKVDLTKVNNKELDEEKYTKELNEFFFVLPQSKKEIKFKLLTYSDRKEIDEEIERRVKFDKSPVKKRITTLLKKTIIEVQGNRNKIAIDSFVDNELFSVDSKSLREYVFQISPSLSYEQEWICPNCNELLNIDMDTLSNGMEVNFFYPTF